MNREYTSEIMKICVISVIVVFSHGYNICVKYQLKMSISILPTYAETS